MSKKIKKFFKKFINFSLGLSFLASFSLTVNLCNQYIYIYNNDIQRKNKSYYIKNTENKYKMWFDSIKESQEANTIKIFGGLGTTFPLQQIVSIANYMLVNSNNEEIFWLAPPSILNKNTYVQHFLDKYKEKNKNFHLISNVNEIPSIQNGSNENYDSKISDIFLDAILKYYDEKFHDQNYKFDLWLVDLSFVYTWTESKLWYSFFKKINKIYILSDGNWQTYYFIKDYIKRLNSLGYKQPSKEEVVEDFKKFQNDLDYTHYNDFKKYNFYDILLNDDFIKIFHIEEYSDSKNYQIPNNMKMYKNYTLSTDYSAMANHFFKNDITKKEEYISNYEIAFKIENNKKIEDFFRNDNINKFDKKKKNLIWIGDSLILDKSHKYHDRQMETSLMFKSYLKLYPISQYNWIIKNHPRYSIEQEKDIVGYMTKNNKEIIDNLIYFKNIPWELIISWDKKMKDNDSNYSSLFDVKDNNVKTRFITFQFTTTAILSTWFFLTNTWGYNHDISKKIINIENNPIPSSFDIILRTTTDSRLPKDEQLKINKNKILDIYNLYIEQNKFVDLSLQLSITNYLKKNNPEIWKEFYNKSNKYELISISIFIPTLISIIAIFVCCSVIQNKRKIKNEN